jgi:ribosome recycling factor
MIQLDTYLPQFEKVLDHLRHEITTLRTGRATPALVEDIPVLAYDTTQQLKAVASISVADAKTLTVDPWDKALVIAVEEAIRNSDLGIQPVNDGKLIRISLPELTSERRADLIKLLYSKLEHARISVRKVREDVRSDIDRAFKAKEMGEDDKFNMQDDLEKLVKENNEKIKEIGDAKEQEITTI